VDSDNRASLLGSVWRAIQNSETKDDMEDVEPANKQYPEYRSLPSTDCSMSIDDSLSGEWGHGFKIEDIQRIFHMVEEHSS